MSFESLLSYSTDVSVIRVIDNWLLPSSFTLDFGVEVAEDADEADIILVLDKFDYWLKNFVHNSVVAYAANEQAMDMMLNEGVYVVGNNLMLTPESPVDGHFLVLLTAKLNAFGRGVVTVGGASISPAERGLANTIMGDPSETLPEMHEWVAGENWFDEPWWNRDDGSTMDNSADEDANLEEIPHWAISLDFLAESDETKSPVIVRKDFVPKVIE